MNSTMQIFLADSAMPVSLLSVYKPVLIAIVLLPYAWVTSSRLEKDASYFNLGAVKWASVFLGAAVLAIAAVLFIPIFWIGWPLMTIVLVATLYGYMSVRNNQVPENRRYKLAIAGMAEAAATRREARLNKSASITLHGRSGRSPIPGKDDPAAPAYALMESWVVAPLLSGAWRLDIVPVTGGAVPVVTRDGVRTKGEPAPAALAIPAMDVLRRTAGFDVEDRRRPQRGSIQIKSPEADSDALVFSSGGSAGQSLRLEFNSIARHRIGLNDLGFHPKQREFLETFGDQGERRGVVLVCAPTGHGLVTTLYSLTARHDAYTASVKTFERQIEAPLEGVDQVQFDPSNAAIDYPTSFRSIIRRGPDVITCVDASEKGIGGAISGANIDMLLTYAGFPVATSQEAIQSWLRSCGGDAKMASKLLRGLVCQRLVRRLCTSCRVPIQVSVEQAAKVGIRTDKPIQLFRAGGKVQVKNRIEDCPDCGGTGFKGQIAVFETIPFPAEAKSALEMGNLAGVLQAGRKAGGIMLSEAAMMHVRAGTTSFEEVQRVLRPAAASAKPAAATAAMGN